MTYRQLEKLNWIQKGYGAQVAYNVADQLKQYVYKRSEEAFAKGDAARDAIKDLAGFEAYRESMREKVIRALGGIPEYSGPLNPRITGKVQKNGFTIEKVIYESRPQTYVTANLYLPDGLTSPTGTVVFVCGHYNNAKHEPEYQLICQCLAQTGLIVFAQDPIGQGERYSYYERELEWVTEEPGTREHNYAGMMCMLLGHSIARYFVHDTIRGVDYLCTRPEVDPERIGITGNSGGGVQCGLMMVCDPRIAAAAPGNYIMNRHSYIYSGQDQDAEQVWNGVSAFGFDHEDVLLMMTPKPVLVLASKYDFFPIEGTRTTVERVRRFWKYYGKEDCLVLFEDDAPHTYSMRMARKAAEFFSLYLLGKDVATINKNVVVKPFAPELLLCTNSGQVRGDFDDARAVYEENCRFVKEMEEYRKSLPDEERKERAVAWLRKKVLGNRRYCDLNPRHLLKEQVHNLVVNGSYWWSREGIFNHWLMFRDFRYKDKKLPVTVAIWDNGTADLCHHQDWICRTCSKGRMVVVLDVTATGMVNVSQSDYESYHGLYGKTHKLAFDLIWLDDSIAAIRVNDVIRALDLLEQQQEVDLQDLHFYLHGRYGIYGQLAALIDDRIKSMEIAGGIESYAELVTSRYYDQYDVISIIIPGILKYFDLPDIERWTGIRLAWQQKSSLAPVCDSL